MLETQSQCRVFSFEGIVPVVHPSAYVHPSAVLIGDVIVGAECYIGAGAVMRGDFGRIELRRQSNLQDNCVVHSLPDFDCIMDERSHIGHGAIIHGCHIGREVLVGMNAVVLDRAVIGEQSIIAAMALIKMKDQSSAACAGDRDSRSSRPSAGRCRNQGQGTRHRPVC